ncbi:hypothetical protein GCM10022295_19410 [Streptomyces osmaniensis]|uniref:Uncharacterized protein n=1 Tax=Streptomyces osmaniensis TaxID=593134 RepID=A0ABP6VKA6_9ACTN
MMWSVQVRDSRGVVGAGGVVMGSPGSGPSPGSGGPGPGTGFKGEGAAALLLNDESVSKGGGDMSMWRVELCGSEAAGWAVGVTGPFPARGDPRVSDGPPIMELLTESSWRYRGRFPIPELRAARPAARGLRRGSER